MSSPKTTAVTAKEPVFYRERTYMMWKMKWEGGGEVPAQLSGTYSTVEEAKQDYLRYISKRNK